MPVGIRSRLGLNYYGQIWDKTVIAVSPNYTYLDCSNCGHRVKKSLSTRTHKCPNCQIEICRDPNAALNILKKGMSILGVEYNSGATPHGFPVLGNAHQESTLGHRETAELSGTLEESETAVDNGKPDSISRLVESRII